MHSIATGDSKTRIKINAWLMHLSIKNIFFCRCGEIYSSDSESKVRVCEVVGKIFCIPVEKKWRKIWMKKTFTFSYQSNLAHFRCISFIHTILKIVAYTLFSDEHWSFERCVVQNKRANFQHLTLCINWITNIPHCGGNLGNHTFCALSVECVDSYKWNYFSISKFH